MPNQLRPPKTFTERLAENQKTCIKVFAMLEDSAADKFHAMILRRGVIDDFKDLQKEAKRLEKFMMKNTKPK